MKYKIYSPTRNAMQSGMASLGEWVIAIADDTPPPIDPLMGWTGMPDTAQELELRFATQEEAIDYANKNGLVYELVAPKKRIVKPKSYAINFAYKKENRA